MKPQERRYQTATQVKGLSSEIVNIDEADSVHKLEGSRMRSCKSSASLVRGLRPWYGIERMLYELGRPVWFPREWILTDNPKRKESRKDGTGFGLIHSRGVTGVTPCEGEPTRRDQRMRAEVKGNRASTRDWIAMKTKHDLLIHTGNSVCLNAYEEPYAGKSQVRFCEGHGYFLSWFDNVTLHISKEWRTGNTN